MQIKAKPLSFTLWASHFLAYYYLGLRIYCLFFHFLT